LWPWNILGVPPHPVSKLFTNSANTVSYLDWSLSLSWSYPNQPTLFPTLGAPNSHILNPIKTNFNIMTEVSWYFILIFVPAKSFCDSYILKWILVMHLMERIQMKFMNRRFTRWRFPKLNTE
jgi:hypothetical protein